MRIKRLDGMLLATFLTTLFYSATYPYIHKEIMMVASDQLVAINQIINCLSIVIFGSLWNKYSNRLFKFYPIVCVVETILSIGSAIFAYKTETDRVRFDNNNNSASAIATIIGSLIAIGLNLDFEVMLCIATIGNTIDNIFYIFIYKSVDKRTED